MQGKDLPWSSALGIFEKMKREAMRDEAEEEGWYGEKEVMEEESGVEWSSRRRKKKSAAERTGKMHMQIVWALSTTRM
jgi:hypothetical protein